MARGTIRRDPHLAQALGEAGDDSRTLIAACALLALAYVESDRAERAVEVLRQAAAAVGHRTATLAVTEGLGSVEPEVFRDARLGVVLEASIAVVGKMDERTAPAAWRLAEGLQGRLRTLPDAPVHLSRYWPCTRRSRTGPPRLRSLRSVRWCASRIHLRWTSPRC